jgi:hypothetical protein
VVDEEEEEGDEFDVVGGERFTGGSSKVNPAIDSVVVWFGTDQRLDIPDEGGVTVAAEVAMESVFKG